MKRFLRRHRWTLLSAVGVVLLVLFAWVGPYVYWRTTDCLASPGFRVIFVPDWLPSGTEQAFAPLAAGEGWIMGETIIFYRFATAFPSDRMRMDSAIFE